MTNRGLLADFTPAAMSEAAGVTGPSFNGDGTRDLRKLLWCSIDNDDSRDLDQLSVAEALPDGAVEDFGGHRRCRRCRREVARPSTIMPRQNTTSVYTAAKIFPMLPEKLSTDLTSLG